MRTTKIKRLFSLHETQIIEFVKHLQRHYMEGVRLVAVTPLKIHYRYIVERDALK